MSPYSVSRSPGVRTWRAVTREPDARAPRSRASGSARSPTASRRAAQSPSGAAWRHPLDEDAHDLRALGRAGDERRVDERRDRRLEDRLRRLIRPYFDGVEGVLHRVDRGRVDLDPAAQQARDRRRRPGTPAAGRATRLTLATEPGVRMLPARQRIDGPTVTGSTSVVSSCFGSSPETTARAAISSPPSRTTPVTAPSRVVTCATRAPVRISAPAARAAAASASDRADRAALREHGLARGAAVVAGGVGEEDLRSSPRTTAPSPCTGRRATRRSRGSPRSRTTRRRSPRPPSRARAGSSGRRACRGRGTRARAAGPAARRRSPAP